MKVHDTDTAEKMKNAGFCPVTRAKLSNTIGSWPWT
jgi:hypothetical protein